MSEPLPLPSPHAVHASTDPSNRPTANAAELQIRHAMLPRIRASQYGETVSEAATNDVSSVGALAPGSSTTAGINTNEPRRPGGLAGRRANRAAAAAARASQPLHRMLAQFDAPDRVRWSGITMVLFYIITVITWPSLFVSILGAATGVIGFLSCSQPYTVTKIMWVYVYQWLNIAMLLVIWWTAIDQLVLHGEGSANAGVGYMYQAAFILLGSVLHGRTLSATSALVRKCRLRALIVDTVWPERWRRQPQPEATQAPDDEEPSTESRPSLLSGEDRASSSDSVHSFEIDVEWYQETRRPRSDVPVSPVGSSMLSPSPVSSYKRIEDPPQ